MDTKQKPGSISPASFAERPSRVLLVGYGSVAQTLTPLLLGHFDLSPAQVMVLAADELGRPIAEHYGLFYENLPLTSENYASVLSERLAHGEWLINLSVNVSSLALVRWCQQRGISYLDTSIETWPGCDEHRASVATCQLRHEILDAYIPGAPTAIVAHGANPGLISHLVKAGLIELAKAIGQEVVSSYAQLARNLDIKVVQIAERDTQEADIDVAHGEFFNTWSVSGFLAEAWQYAELGWGSHEKSIPRNARVHRYGDGCGISLEARGAEVRIKSWIPGYGEQNAYLMPHYESLSIASLLTIPQSAGGELAYSPTVCYAYRPSSAACKSLDYWIEGGFRQPTLQSVMTEVLESGANQLGALFVFPGGCYWYGSELKLEQARAIAPHGNATSLQVAAGVLGALEWMARNPGMGIVEAEALDADIVMGVAMPYLGNVFGVLGEWQPGVSGNLQLMNFISSRPICAKSAA